jgi:hypothetical protein
MIDAPDKGASQNSERRNTSLQEQKESKTDGQKELYFVDGSCSNPEEVMECFGKGKECQQTT